MEHKAGDYTITRKRGKTIIKHPDKLGKVIIYGNGHAIETFYSTPDWSDQEEEAFKYKGWTYYLSEFMRIDPNAPEWMQAYDGNHNDSFFSGILIRWSEELDGYQVYTYIA